MKHELGITVRLLPSFTLLCVFAAASSTYAAPTKGPASHKEPLIFAINEGATTQVTVGELVERYMPLAKFMERALDRPVKVDVYPETARFKKELEQKGFDIIFGKTVNLLAETVRDKHFHAVAKMKAPYVAGFITSQDSSVRKPEDIRGRVIMMPKGVFTTDLAHATLRDLGIKETDVTIRYTRLQEAVAHAVEIGMVDIGVVNPTVKRNWREKGNPVVLETKPVPNWSMIVSPRMDNAELERLRGVLIDLKNSPEGLQALKVIGVPEFVAATDDEYLELLKYIGAPIN